MTSFRTPREIIEEWSHVSGLSDLTEMALLASFEAVEKRISVGTVSSHNKQNQLLVDGCKALGLQANMLRNNGLSCEQRCGFCGFGCRCGCKQSTMKTYLQDAYDHGAGIIVRCSSATRQRGIRMIIYSEGYIKGNALRSSTNTLHNKVLDKVEP